MDSPEDVGNHVLLPPVRHTPSPSSHADRSSEFIVSVCAVTVNVTLEERHDVVQI